MVEQLGVAGEALDEGGGRGVVKAPFGAGERVVVGDQQTGMALAEEGDLPLDGGAEGRASARQPEADRVVDLVVELHIGEAVGKAFALDGREQAVESAPPVYSKRSDDGEVEYLAADSGVGKEAEGMPGLVLPASEGDVDVVAPAELQQLQEAVEGIDAGRRRG